LATPGDEIAVGFGGILPDDRNQDSAVGAYLRVDPKTGNESMIAPVAAVGDTWWPSGDLVTVIDTCKKTTITWATVLGPKTQTLCRACEAGMTVGLDCGDCVFEFGLKDGSFTKNLGVLPFSSVFGLAFWGGTLVGFAADGSIFTIDPSSSPLKTRKIELTLPPGFKQISWMGAGSTTVAPLADVH
jgi:hypothetical protein